MKQCVAGLRQWKWEPKRESLEFGEDVDVPVMKHGWKVPIEFDVPIQSSIERMCPVSMTTWLGTAIGQGNHRLFMLLVVVEVTVQWLHFAMCFVFLRTEVVKDGCVTYFDCAYYMVTQYPFVVFVMLMHFFSSPGIAFLLANHLYLVAVNLTTNEMINSYRYDHFWEVTNGRKVFKNPFNKGVFSFRLELLRILVVSRSIRPSLRVMQLSPCRGENRAGVRRSCAIKRVLT
eukprot:s71_g33.t1